MTGDEGANAGGAGGRGAGGAAKGRAAGVAGVAGVAAAKGERIAEPLTARIALVGAGPQALRALAELDDALAGDEAPARAPVRVVAIDPFDPGAGAIWRVDQPGHLRMNVSARIVDLRCPSIPLDLEAWYRRDSGSDCPQYPARAVVGRYLRWAWSRLERSPRLDLVHVRGTVVGVSREAAGWRCRVDGADRPEVDASHVVLCTGHRDGAMLDHAGLAAGAHGTGPGERVVVRGAALTAFDAVMSMTAGRGGRWAGGGRPLPRSAPIRLRYEPSGREPASILLVSRSGRMMLPKPDAPTAAVAAAVGETRSRWAETVPLGEAWWGALFDAARAAARARGVEVSENALRSCLADPPRTLDSRALAERWSADLRRAAGEVDADPAWWLGRAWSAAYSEVLASLERAPRDPETWGSFRRRAASLERWAFGPPAPLVARLVALLEEGRLGVVAEAEGPPASPCDIVAHIPGPGVLEGPRPWRDRPSDAGRPACDSPLWSGLLRAGHVTVRRGEPGVLTEPDGTCVAASGSPSTGLYALGRPTEGPVIDHDSLQRALHLDARRWARGEAAALASQAACVATERWETRTP